MNIWFKSDGKFLACLDTNTKPSVGDMVLLRKEKYIVTEVLWCFEEPPAQLGIIVYIEKKQ